MSHGPLYQGRLLLCRHGQAGGNVHGAFLGLRDDALTETGRAQALNLARLLAEEEIHQLICSPLRRAAETAAAVAQLKGLPLERDPRLVEQDFGSWEGYTFAEVRGREPEAWAAWLADANRHAPGNGETLAAVADRVEAVWRDLDLRGGRTVALVAHAGCLQALLCRILGVPTRAMWPFRLAVGSVTEVEFTAGGPSMTRLSAV